MNQVKLKTMNLMKIKKMMEAYVKYSISGDINQNKESQEHWIIDINPRIECNIGFIESYLDLSGAKAGREG